jgi:hypothetical protein
MPPPISFRNLVEEESPPWLLGALSGGFVGVVLGLMADTIAEGMGAAVRMPWLLEPLSPPDILPFVGKERKLPRYPGESQDQYRVRMHGAWEAYQYGGDESAIIGQLAKAGWVGARIYDPWNFGFAVTPYYSQFVVWFPIGSHTVVSAGPAIGSFTVGDGTIIGPVGITPAQLATVRGIIRKWKPVEWICRWIHFQVSGWAIGDGHLVGEPGLLIGGTTVVVSP